MKQLKYLVCLVALSGAVQVAQGAQVPEAALDEGDLENCDVLLGREKKAAFGEEWDASKRAAAGGDADSLMHYGAILNNKMACINEESTGSSGWGVIMTSADGSSSEAVDAPVADPARIPELAATLREAVRVYELAARTELNARVMLGTYYADYNNFLKQPGKGYVHTASVFQVECVYNGKRTADAPDRCDGLRHDRIRYNSLILPAQRSKLDAEAKAWADAYLARKKGARKASLAS